MLWPDGFRSAIGLAGLGCTLFAVIFPARMVLAARARTPSGKEGTYRAAGGRAGACAVGGFGMAVMLCWLAGTGLLLE